MKIFNVFLFLCLSFVGGQGLQEMLDYQNIEKGLSLHLQNKYGRKGVIVSLETTEKQIHAPRHNHELLFQIEKKEDVIFIRALYELPEHMQQEIQTKLQEKYSVKVQNEPFYYGIIGQRGADLLVEPTGEKGTNLASQFIFGTCFSVWEEKDNFVRVQSQEDGYIGWLDKTDFWALSKESFQILLNAKKIFLAECKEEYPIGSIFYLFQGKIISILQCNNEEISYITQKETKTIQGKAMNNAPSISWDLCSQKNSILTTIQRFLRNNDCGKNEYLWGGTVLPGLDCSGFVQLVYRLQDISIPRDASQQQQFGQAVEKNDLQIGDLVFFSSHKKWATHVGIYMGNGKFVHCSRVGEYSGVKINDLQGNTEYDQYLNNIYFGATRIQP